MRNLSTALLLISLTACSSVPETIMVDTAPVARAPLQVPDVDRISTKPVEWIVITPDNVDDVFSQLKADNKSIVVFALSSTGYENLSLNIAELTKLIKQQQAINKAYITYYETEQ